MHRVISIFFLWSIGILILFTCIGCTNSTNQNVNEEALKQETVNKNELRDKAYISGKVIHKSDVMTIPDSPYSSGLILAVSSESLMSLLDHAETPNLESTQLNKELFSNYIASSTSLEKDGNYSLYLKPGSYSLCACNLGASHPDPEAFPIYIYSCLDIVVKGGESHSVDIFFGMGGMGRIHIK